jgi:hypothetical protein
VQQQQDETVILGQLHEKSLDLESRRRIVLDCRNIVFERQTVILPLAKTTVAAVEAHPRQPVLEWSLGPVGVELPPGLQEGLLGYIFNFFSPPEETAGESEYTPLVSQYQLSKDVAVPTAGSGDELGFLLLWICDF